MISSILSRLVILLFGTLYPAYASYKAVRTKNVKEYVKWMMYWIVFALFTCIETFTDVFLSWFPFYYEIKIVLVIWLLSPATKGSSILYRKFVHPMLSSREQEIDDYITKAKEQSYRQVLDLGSKGVSALMQTAIKGGGGIVNQLKKSYSLSDLTDSAHDDGQDETDVLITDPRLVRRRRSPHVGSSSTSNIYFSEVDVRADRIASIQSAEDISSGYSSGEGLYAGQPPKLLAREGLQRTGSLTRSRTTRVTRSTIIKKSGGSDDSDENEVFDTNIIFLNDKAKKIDNLVEDKPDPSSSEEEFLDTLDTLHDNKKLGENLNNFNKCSDKSPLLTACLESQQDLDVVKYSLTKNSSFAHSINNETADLKENVEVNEEKILNTEDNLNILNITKDVDTFSNFLQNLIESKAEKNETTNSQDSSRNKDGSIVSLKDPQKPTIIEKALDKVKTDVHPSSDKDVKEYLAETANHGDKSTVIERTFDKVKIDVHPPSDKDAKELLAEAENRGGMSTTTERTFEKVKVEVQPPSNKDIKESLAETENRGGKYNKKAAPLPPKSEINPTEPYNTPASPIKATLILKPGVVKNLGSKESLSKEVFIQSPKSKRRNSVNRSPSSASTSSTSSKTKHSLSKLMRLPKKIGFWNKDELSVSKAKEKRSSWHCSFDEGLKPLSDSKLQSKSDNDLAQIVPLHGSNMPRSGSQVSILSLTESPLAHRRLKIIRRYVDEDID